ncbi:transcriptional regulator family: Fungal Specific TF [Penicillium capsulatum]|uniref:Transcriptional regulator family: Fungal Specific TF n=1 Tax=Penicillium capsulatum TaxID=69766 RepID=A0A9W9M046_9EURO|nr:transcriptional regulator family: Fungal Specific TF [Penicillium capsulatum]KAJ6129732.1 transcriptional regulator family: Fungal Specific TF [Penicillium capsulatum]
MAEPIDSKPVEPANHSAQTAQLPEHPQESMPESNQDSGSTPNPHQGTPPANTHQQSSGDHTNEQQNATTHVENTSFNAMDSAIASMETSHPLAEDNMNSWDTSLQSVGSSAAADLSLPALDTTLPSLDSSLPAIGTDIPTMDSAFGDDSPFDTNDHHHSGSDNPGDTGNSLPPPGSANGSTHYQAAPNGGYQYNPNPPPQQHSERQQPPPAPSQHQFQAQPQPSYQHQSPDMYHNQGGFSAVNANNGQGQHGQMPQAPIGSPMPPMSSMGQYMTGYPSNVPQHGMDARYSMPGDPSKMLSGGRHKKEVKRRTKTGCLTCRKRRIKCDEGHPVCRNCVKSKRECLGYDPVFRPSASTPSAIQPAPNPPPSLVVNPQGPPPSSATPAYPSAPPGYMPASSQPFAPSLPSESPSASTDQADRGASIDSSFAASHTPTPMNMQASIDPRPQSSEPSYKAKNLQVNDLLALRGVAPPPPHAVGALPPGRLEEIQAVFLATYAPAIDKLLEVRWYSEKALAVLMADQQLMADYSALINAFNDWNLSDGNTLARLESFEASIVWRSMVLCRQAPNAENGQYGQDFNLVAATARLNAIEALLSWNYLDHNPLSQASGSEAANPPNSPDQFTQRQLDFWSELGDFLTLHDNEASSAKQIDDTLGRCRQLLDTYENRDIIYSIAIARHLGQRWADFPNSLPKLGTTSEKETGTKLFVAQKFIEEEAEGKGTTQIYKRICCMAVRSWWVARE